LENKALEAKSQNDTLGQVPMNIYVG
jgi:hypothetical protein